MMDYIDRVELLLAVAVLPSDASKNDYLRVIYDLPAQHYVPVIRHEKATWEPHESIIWSCSNCGAKWNFRSPFCARCGAEME